MATAAPPPAPGASVNGPPPQRVAVVTGASGGIGRATAVAFARRGWRVALLARGIEGLEGARADVEAAGGRALVVPTDVADAAAVEAAADRVVAEWGGIDVWVNNAMATIFGPAVDVAPADYRRATDVTYHGAVWGTLAALKRMKRQGRGTIVQVGSALAYRSIPLQAAYCGAKSALRGFTDAIRSELIHERSPLHVTMVQLSAFNTPQFDWGRNLMPQRPRPVGKIFQPEIAAEAIYYAATHRRREVWVGAPAVQAILGQRFVPRYLDRRLAHEAWEGQFDTARESPGRADNLHAPVREDHGAHGRFDAAALPHSLQWTLNANRGWLAGVALLLLATAGGRRLAERRRT